MGNYLFLPARGWGIDRQERKKLQIPGGAPGGGWLQVELNPALGLSTDSTTVSFVIVEFSYF